MNLKIGKLYHFSDKVIVPEDIDSIPEWSVMDRSGKNCIDTLKPFSPFLLLDQQKYVGTRNFDYKFRILTTNGKNGFIHLYKNELKKFFPSKETT